MSGIFLTKIQQPSEVDEVSMGRVKDFEVESSPVKRNWFVKSH